jgi:hypothetical protein
VGKRSPILGYNHNVLYRGLVFHVQTEDSGVASPHLFTHLFHAGVIISTRKLVYDAGSAEESIRSLMQAQHKAVLKDLRRGHFDDKIDSYLGGTPGLLARGAEDTVERPTEPTEAGDPGEIDLATPGMVEDAALAAATDQVIPLADELSEPVMIVEQTPPPGRPPTRNLSAPTSPPATIPSRTTTNRPLRPTPPAIDTTLKTPVPTFDAPDSAPEIEISLEMDDGGEAVSVPRRAPRDTETSAPIIPPARPTLNSDTRPTLGMVSEEVRRAAAVSDGIPGAIRSQAPAIPAPADPRRLGDRPSTINAATLPPARPISRPSSRPAVSQPQVVTRPLATDDRSRRESEAIEVYSPAPGSVELPSGTSAGQYAQYSKKISTRIPIDGLKDVARDVARDAIKDVPKPTPSAAVPAGLGRPARAGSPTTHPPRSAMVGPSGSAPVAARPVPQTEPIRARVPTPSRMSGPGTVGPTPSRVGSTGGSGVVMTRPAVIVGAPAKSPGTVPRIRKAREDEGRGFGQGLISEKSLDEVILAYLSEDADDK